MLENYTYKFAKRFERNLSETLEYIKNELKNVSAADALLTEMEKVVKERSKSPKINKPFYKDKDNKESLYKIKVRNFYVIYVLDDDKKIMKCIDFIYTRSEIMKHTTSVKWEEIN